MHYKMLSAICFSLDQFKILSFGNGLNTVKMLLSIPFRANVNKLDIKRCPFDMHRLHLLNRLIHLASVVTISPPNK